MGHTGIFKCDGCGHKFKASVGGTFISKLFRCLDCDTTKGVPYEDIPMYMHRMNVTKPFHLPTPAEIGVCLKCGGKLDEHIGPMCPKCKSRSVKQVKVTLYYD